MSRLCELAEFLDVSIEEIDEVSFDDKMFEYEGAEYLVLTETEAEQRAYDSLTDDRYFWKCAVENDRTTLGLEDWADYVIQCDGLGHLLSGYDGSEEWTDNYIIFRTN